MKRRNPATPLLIIVVALTLAPGLILAFTTLGGGQLLGIATSGTGYQRDVRVWNNAVDPTANPNGATDPSLPGASGAALAGWRASRAWNSDTPTAGGNFDYDWQGAATASNPNQNTISFGDTGCSGSVLAYTETPVNDGWRILVCESAWVWYADNGTPTAGQYDLRGVLTHELGHALGLGHSQTANCAGSSCSSNPCMCAFICGTGAPQRVITADDQAGVQSIYGTIPANKPLITSVSGSLVTGGTITIMGQNFAPTVSVKFSARTSTNTGSIPGVVTNVPSTLGGTRLTVVVPSAAVSGNVVVWEPALGVMSNAFPIGLGLTAPAITSVTPQSVPAFGDPVVTLTGTAFSPATQVVFGGVTLSLPGGFTIVNDTTITFPAPPAQAFGPATVTVTNPTGTSAPANFAYVEVDPPLLITPGLTSSAVPYTATFAGGANDTYFLVAALDPTTTSFLGFTVLQNYFVVTSGALNPLGQGSHTVQIPPGLTGITFRMQVATVSDTTASFVGASNITLSAIIF